VHRRPHIHFGKRSNRGCFSKFFRPGGSGLGVGERRRGCVDAECTRLGIRGQQAEVVACANAPIVDPIAGERALGFQRRGLLFSKDLLEILACPACKSQVALEDAWVVCRKCLRRYPIRDGIPVMLVEEAEQAGRRRRKP